MGTEFKTIETIGVLVEIARERGKQEGMGYTPREDDRYKDGELERAATCFVGATLLTPYRAAILLADIWPWGVEYFNKQTTKREKLIKAAALIVAEIERMDRLQSVPTSGKDS